VGACTVTVTQGGDTAPPSAAEQRVLDAIDHRGVADFSGMPEQDRQLSGEFIESLIAGTNSRFPRLCCPLRVRGAQVTGPIRVSPGIGQGAGVTLLFWNCEFDSPLDFSGADVLVLRLVDCVLPAFVGISLTTKADLDFSGSQISGVQRYAADLADVADGAVHLNHAKIGGRLLMSSTPNSRFQSHGSIRLDGARVEGNAEFHGALLSDAAGKAVSARSATFGGNFELVPGQGNRCEVFGEVCLVAAEIVGDLDCSGALLTNPEGRALHCEDLAVESVFLTRETPAMLFEASGRLNFLTAIVGGSFFLTHARLSPGPDYEGTLSRGGKVALNMQQIRISNALVLFNIAALGSGDAQPQPVNGWYMLSGASMSTLIDHADSGWPEHGFLDLDGAAYQRIRHIGDGAIIPRRKAWLRRQFRAGRPNASSFRPQPYEQLTRVLRDSGLSREADAIAVEKIRMRLAAKVDPPSLRLFPRVLMLVSHHGYSTSRAILSFVIFVLLGTLMYSLALRDFGQSFVPFDQEPEATLYELPFGLGEVETPLGCPGLDTLHYALDFALPVINLGQDDYCRFFPVGSGREAWLVLHSLYGLFGAAISAVVVLTLTGLLRRD